MNNINKNRFYLLVVGLLIMPVVSMLMIMFSSPSIAKETLVQELSAQRDNNGGITIIGRVKLPKGTKLMLDVKYKNYFAQDNVIVADNGKFSSVAFSNKNKPCIAGTYDVTVIAYFTKMFGQPSDVIAKVGEGGKLLPITALIPDDPEFPEAGGHLKETRKINFPSLSSELLIIETVKETTLVVTGKGRSADPIKNVVAYFESAGGFKALKWSAKQVPSGVWIVTLDCIDGGNNKQAQWEYNPTTKAVRYLDPLAKLLSWLPSE